MANPRLAVALIGAVAAILLGVASVRPTAPVPAAAPVAAAKAPAAAPPSSTQPPVAIPPAGEIAVAQSQTTSNAAAEPRATTVAAAALVATPAARVVAAPPAAAPVAVGDGARSRAVTAGSTAGSRIALTFDAGADAGHATAILDMLADAHVHASFGVTGQWAEQNPALVRRMVADGHQIINHTYDHDSFTGYSTNGRAMSQAQRMAELDRTEAIFQSIAGITARPYFRPPYGDMDGSVLDDVGAHGYSVTAMWAVDSLGWNGLAPGGIVERVLRLSSPGAILIFHVGAESADAIALPQILTGLRDRGYNFVTVAGLLAP